jgi:hypothetical protein
MWQMLAYEQGSRRRYLSSSLRFDLNISQKKKGYPRLTYLVTQLTFETIFVEDSHYSYTNQLGRYDIRTITDVTHVILMLSTDKRSVEGSEQMQLS